MKGVGPARELASGGHCLFLTCIFFSSILPPSEMSACYGSIACMALYLERGTGEFH